MEPSAEQTSTQKIPESAKISFDYCPFCGGKVEEAKTLTKERCVYEDCGKVYMIRTY